MTSPESSQEKNILIISKNDAPGYSRNEVDRGSWKTNRNCQNEQSSESRAS